MGLLDGKVAVITGAGGGLGRAYALLFAKEGASVVVNDYGGQPDGTGAGSSPLAESVVDEIKAAGGQAVADGSDVSRETSGEQILKTALDAFGRIDILVNNAGILRDKSLLKLEEADWDAVNAVNLKGTFFVTKPIFRWIKENGQGGVIVNTSSPSGLLGAFGQANYAAAKAGIFGFSNTLAIEGAKAGIRVWTLAPSATTRLTASLLPPELAARWSPDRVAPTVLYMVSALSGDRTGKVVFANGTKVVEAKLIAAEGLLLGDEIDVHGIAAAADRIFHPEAAEKWFE